MVASTKIGLEIHVQIEGKKLFCNCKTESHNEIGVEFVRRLTATTGESGKLDPAALYEKSRARSFKYRITDNSCLLEADEEPPHEINGEALLKGVAVALSLNCRLVDEVSFMRKIVIDGSNTSGFQRTAIIGFNGYVETSKGKVGISSVCLEEDSAKKIQEEGGVVTYSLDRLGVPLLEIATEPEIVDGDHAIETAEMIGKKLILAGWARKAPDAIRQDVNFSMGFGRVEIKGVPKLSTIGDALKFEKERQEWIAELAPMIKGNDWKRLRFTDVTELFRSSKSKMISRSLSEGHRIYGTVLPGLDGYLKKGLFRVGRELADVAKLFGAGGIMHSDELPGYGVETELPELVRELGPGKGDGYAIIISDPMAIELVQTAMQERMNKLSNLDLSETRVVSETGETHYLRPLPGGERMYPETDIQTRTIDSKLVENARKIAPRDEEELVAEMLSRYGISHQDATVILQSGKKEQFSGFAEQSGNSRTASRLILQTIPDIEKKTGKQVPASEVSEILIMSRELGWDRQVLETVITKRFVEGLSTQEIISSKDMVPIGRAELTSMIKDLLGTENVSEKNIIPKLRQKTSRTFDPSMAIMIIRELKS